LDRGRGTILQVANPDVAKLDWVSVLLEQDRSAVDGRIVGERLEPAGLAPWLLAVLNQDTVEENRNPGRLDQLAAAVVPRPAKGDVKSLPLARWPCGVEQRRILPVNGARHAIGVGVRFVGIEHLDLELAHEEDAAVAAILACADRRSGRGPLDVKLKIAETRLRLDWSCPRRDLEDSVLQQPASRPALGRFPGAQAGSIEQDDRVPRRGARGTGRVGDRRLGPVHVVLPPSQVLWGLGQEA